MCRTYVIIKSGFDIYELEMNVKSVGMVMGWVVYGLQDLKKRLMREKQPITTQAVLDACSFRYYRNRYKKLTLSDFETTYFKLFNGLIVIDVLEETSLMLEFLEDMGTRLPKIKTISPLSKNWTWAYGKFNFSESIINWHDKQYEYPRNNNN